MLGALGLYLFLINLHIQYIAQVFLIYESSLWYYSEEIASL